MVALATPEPFFAVGLWYRHFEAVEDREIEALLAAAVTPGEAERLAGNHADDRGAGRTGGPGTANDE